MLFNIISLSKRFHHQCIIKDSPDISLSFISLLSYSKLSILFLLSWTFLNLLFLNRAATKKLFEKLSNSWNEKTILQKTISKSSSSRLSFPTAGFIISRKSFCDEIMLTWSYVDMSEYFHRNFGAKEVGGAGLKPFFYWGGWW